MKASASDKGFTLIELLVATGVLALIVTLAAQMTSATIASVSNTSNRLDGSESVRAASRMLRDELAGLIANDNQGRYLNLLVKEDEAGVALYFTVPRPQTADLAKLGFVSHVAYVWDRDARTLSRAEYHSSREPDAILQTAQSERSDDHGANLGRLQKITPSYKGGTPYAWTAESFWGKLLTEAKRNPIVANVDDWKVECLESMDASAEVSVNAWAEPDRLPIALRLTFVVSSSANTKEPAKRTGRPYRILIPLSCVDPA